ncbi:MAG: phage Gp37/Gp68 family protein [Candidatus Cloacimonetes bacterium]|nr:phage Gp37/Gp68 family protein [Candidatus Cloacimonadota bacterium]
MAKTKIEWTECSWNPVTGCTKVSLGCENCYAERMAKRLQAMGQQNYKNGFKVTCHPKVLSYPLKWKKTRLIFVNSMSDLFHEDIPFEFVLKIFQVMNKANWHTFQILTKRPERMHKFADKLNWTPNIWMGVTVESYRYKNRIDILRDIPSETKFLSAEPLIEPLGKLNLNNIDWVIVGGESGIGARPMSPNWVNEIKMQCEKSQIPFFFKQWGGINKKKAGRLLYGKIYNEMPRIVYA